MPRQKALPKKKSQNNQIDINENENRIFDKLLDYDFDEEVDDEEEVVDDEDTSKIIKKKARNYYNDDNNKINWITGSINDEDYKKLKKDNNINSNIMCKYYLGYHYINCTQLSLSSSSLSSSSSSSSSYELYISLNTPARLILQDSRKGIFYSAHYPPLLLKDLKSCVNSNSISLHIINNSEYNIKYH